MINLLPLPNALHVKVHRFICRLAPSQFPSSLVSSATLLKVGVHFSSLPPSRRQHQLKRSRWDCHTFNL